jgi:acyl transferase domain-containing protein
VSGEVALIGMAARFPGARDPASFWANLARGVESITTFSDDELAAQGLLPEGTARVRYVPRRGIIEHADCFDAQFFGVSPRDAEMTDPQARVLLEVAYEALERSGRDPLGGEGVTGVFVGASWSSYLNLIRARGLGTFETYARNDKDFIATWLSHKLDLRGPCVGVQSFCATSLVAVHLACASLVLGECDVALAGGVSISVPIRAGYVYEDGGLISPDGRSRPFDARAEGTVFSDGVGAVVLRRLEDAIADRDPICAVIKGSAINNDGAHKMSFMAPSPAGQTAAVVQALAVAGVEPRTISYVEAHGTATSIGDAVEVDALSRAFRHRTKDVGFCRIGSVKGNVGHLDRAAGMAGLIKTVLALVERTIPPTIHLESPNPEIDFRSSPFVPAIGAAAPWTLGSTPRRAAVNAYGIGGTNAHVVLEEAPEPQITVRPDRAWVVLPLSAKTPAALDEMSQRLSRDLAETSIDLGDAAYTLQVGRPRFSSRRAIVCRDRAFAIERLATSDPLSIDVDAPAALAARARAFVDGQKVGWDDLWVGARPRRVALSTHPFARTRFWIDPPSVPVSAVAPSPDRTVNARIADLVARTLGTASVGEGDDFFALGGDSIAATRLLASIASELGVEIELRAFFAEPTVEHLAALVRDGAPAAAPRLERADRASRRRTIEPEDSA